MSQEVSALIHDFVTIQYYMCMNEYQRARRICIVVSVSYSHILSEAGVRVVLQYTNTYYSNRDMQASI